METTVVYVNKPKKKFSWLKAVGKGLVTAGKGILVVAPIVLDEVVPILKGTGVEISSTIIAGLAILKVVRNYTKNKDNGTPQERN